VVAQLVADILEGLKERDGVGIVGHPPSSHN
jgi:hypothetical protein